MTLKKSRLFFFTILFFLLIDSNFAYSAENEEEIDNKNNIVLDGQIRANQVGTLALDGEISENYTKELKELNNEQEFGFSVNDSSILDEKILRIAIDPILLQIMSRFRDNFQAQLSLIKLDSNFNNETDGVEKLCYNKYNISVLVVTRQLNDYEKNFCLRNAQTELKELKIGHFAYIIASSKSGEQIDLSTDLIYRAIAHSFATVEQIVQNDKKRWYDISRILSRKNIRFYGPFVESSFYNFLVNKIVFPRCISDKYLKEKFNSSEELIKQCKKVRTDGVYIGDSSDSRLTLSKLYAEKPSYGFINYGVYDANREFLNYLTFNGIEPSIENIYNGSYGLSFPIYIYVKKSKIDDNTKLVSLFFNEIKSSNVIGKDSYLKELGFIPLGITDE